jgi:hypothetical protein
VKRGIALAASTIGVAMFVTVMIIGWSVGHAAASSSGTVQAVSASTPHYYLTIATPDMLGGTEDTGPAYMPSNFALPANTDVTMTITNFDNPTALPAQYAKATGVKGVLTIEDLDSVHPNAQGPVHTATSLDPENGVSHTFTIAALGLNVPVAPSSRETFTFHTGAAGVYNWRCMDPCGSGTSGWGAAMSAEGFMQGKVTFD